MRIKFEDKLKRSALLGSNPSGGGEVRWQEFGIPSAKDSVFVVPSRRTIFDAGFQNYESSRQNYVQSYAPGAMRRFQGQFGGRLVRMNAHHNEVSKILERVLGYRLDWQLEPGENGNVRLRVYSQTGVHPIEGAGEGIVSLLFIADALYDANPGDIIVIDEPELSLHPPVQRRLAEVMSEFAAHLQIVYATHSPYFADWRFVIQGAQVARVTSVAEGSKIGNLRRDIMESIRQRASDFRNPHLFGTDAREAFFLGDDVILVEGQEDVIGYRALADQLGLPLRGEFYGWGVGGAGNMGFIARVLRDLGFEHVVGVVDSDKAILAESLGKEFPEFRFIVSPTADIRTKVQSVTAAKMGLLDSRLQLTADRVADGRALLTQINRAFDELASD